MVTSHPLVASSPLVAGVMSRWGVMISITIPSHCIDYVALVGTSFIIHMVYLLLINVNYLSKKYLSFSLAIHPFPRVLPFFVYATSQSINDLRFLFCGALFYFTNVLVSLQLCLFVPEIYTFLWTLVGIWYGHSYLLRPQVESRSLMILKSWC